MCAVDHTVLRHLQFSEKQLEIFKNYLCKILTATAGSILQL